MIKEFREFINRGNLVDIAVAFVLYMASSATGLHRGIKWLSNFNMAAAALLLALVLVLGPTAFVFETLTTTLGAYLNQLPAMSLRQRGRSAAMMASMASRKR